jgi:hypothetical protein
VAAASYDDLEMGETHKKAVVADKESTDGEIRSDAVMNSLAISSQLNPMKQGMTLRGDADGVWAKIVLLRGVQ